jgi:formylglycine-generating enzyme required for sulfatase activity
VQVARANSPDTSLAENETVTVALQDEIRVPESGHAVLQIGRGVTADVLRGSALSLVEARAEPGGALFAKLSLTQGHTTVALRPGANARVRLETGFASITTLEPETQFTVCHDPAVLTCMVVAKGQVEVLAQGKVVRPKAGEGTFIQKGKAPSPAICTHLDEFDAWMNEKLGTGEVKPLGELVAGWKQESCAAATASAASAAATGSPVAGSTPIPLPVPYDMVKIPAGTYTIGYDAPDEYHITPLQKELSAFWIDAYEVTNGQYQAFLEATAHATPAVQTSQSSYPVAGVTWNDAADFCAWSGKRLPTEAEWEVAARGGDPIPPRYPWGDDPNANGDIESLPRDRTYEVGTKAFNVSPFGAHDMAGNLWEWVGDPYYPVAEGMKILRGGRHGRIVDMAYRQQTEPANPRFLPVAGFRCAADKVQGE